MTNLQSSKSCKPLKIKEFAPLPPRGGPTQNGTKNKPLEPPATTPTSQPFTIDTQPLTPLTAPTVPRRHIAARLILATLASLLLAPTPLKAQQPQPRTTILLDPAHGGPEAGATLNEHLVEKDFTLAFAARLRTLLTASGITVIATRDSDPTAAFPTDQRADIANHAHPAACLILHATASGNGIHIITSDLTPPDDLEAPHAIIPWDTAQTASLPQSLLLADELGTALLAAKLPVILSKASIRPLDNLTCPAVAIEIAPLSTADSDRTPITDTAYQQRIGQAISQAILSWRAHNAPAPGAAR
jgi:N-acetylmuramoyl-L-alanine amidase